MKKGVLLILLLVEVPIILLFRKSGVVLEEAGSMQQSKSQEWWLNSGAKLYLSDDVAQTIQGELSSQDPWRKKYFYANPIDTDEGFHPQNIFRLVTRSNWTNLIQEGYFMIERDELSNSSHRDVSNGILFFSHYQDGNNLYYGGIRVDGTAVIKKKVNGTYFLLNQTKVFPGVYDRMKNPSLLPKEKWIGVRTEISNQDESVQIKVLVDLEGEWVVVDQVQDFSTTQLRNGYGGIRTDFMDISFRNYTLRGEEIE